MGGWIIHKLGGLNDYPCLTIRANINEDVSCVFVFYGGER